MDIRPESSNSRKPAKRDAFWLGVRRRKQRFVDVLDLSWILRSSVATIALWSDLTVHVMTLMLYWPGMDVMSMSRIFPPLVGTLTNGTRPVRIETSSTLGLIRYSVRPSI